MSSFDRLQEMNPMPDDRLPSAPHSLAERILARGRRSAGVPGWAIAAAAAAAVVLAGGSWLLFLRGGSEPVAAGDTTTSAPTTTVPVASSTTAPTTTAAAPTTAAPSTTLPPVGPAAEVPVYLVLADNGTENAPGPYLVPTMRTTAVLSAPVTDLHETALAFLLIGPTPGEAEAIPAMSTSIPAGTELLGIEVSDRIATVDLSAEFEEGGDPSREATARRLAQIVYTLTAFDDVAGVRFQIEGRPTVAFGEGWYLEDPSGREDDLFEAALPAVFIDTPPAWGSADNPLRVSGTARVYRGQVSLTLTDGDGLIIWEGDTNASCGIDCRGYWYAEIPYVLEEPQTGALIAWSPSPEDGSQENVREHPIRLTASEDDGSTTTAGDTGMTRWQLIQDLRDRVRAAVEQRGQLADLRATATDPTDVESLEAEIEDLDLIIDGELRPQLVAAVDDALADGEPWDLILDETCSGAYATRSLLDRALERPVLETWGALHAAASQCDWEYLAELAGDGVAHTFGEPGDPIEYWQYLEAIGYEPMFYLAELLDRPWALVDPGNGDAYVVWPSAFAYDTWEDVPAEDVEALRPLYGDADFDAFASFGGYVGHRIGIDATTGEWRFFIAGD
jgi:spore germination protein GerM